MKQLEGPAYSNSWVRGAVDLLATAPILPIAIGAAGIGYVNLRTHGVTASLDYPDIRVGRNGAYFTLHKLRTMYPGTETVVGATGEWFRSHGPDETAQVLNIWLGNLSLWGRRPLNVPEYEEFFDGLNSIEQGHYEREVMPNLPGIISTWADLSHTGNYEPSEASHTRYHCDLEDARHDSFSYNNQLLFNLLKSFKDGKLQHGRINHSSLDVQKDDDLVGLDVHDAA